MEPSTESTALGKGLWDGRGKCRCSLLLSCTSSQPCSGLGCSSWGAGHQIPPPKSLFTSPLLPSAVVWHQKILPFPLDVPSLAPGGEGVSSHPSWHSLCPCTSPEILQCCRLNCLIREYPQLAPALHLFSLSHKSRNPALLRALSEYSLAALRARSIPSSLSATATYKPFLHDLGGGGRD